MKKLLASILLKFNYRILKADTVMFLEPLLMKCLKRNPDFFFIQIGANDGVMTPQRFIECTEFLVKRGYHIIMEQYDAIAYDMALFA